MPFVNLYIVGPLVAFGVIGALALILRWAFDGDVVTTHFLRAPDDRVAGNEDYGLLSVVGTARTPDDARMLQELLESAEIRATTAAAPDGRVRVLVFASELDEARRLLEPS